MASLTDQQKQVIDKPNQAFLSSLMEDGSPHVSQVWIDRDGDKILVNTAEGRVKPRNVRRDPRVAVAVLDGENPYVPVSIRGRVTAVSTEGAEEHIDKLAKKYLDQDTYPFRQEGEVRVVIEIEPH